MWQCPKCQREFINQNQKHYCGEKPKTIDEYIEQERTEVQPILYEVREALRKVLPDAEERISYGMPTYWKKHNLVHFAAQKNHLGFYPGDQAIVHFQDQLRDYKTSKGAIQFPYHKPLPLDLIVEIAKWCYKRDK